MSQVDWLSHLLKIIAVTGRLEVRCLYGAPWRVVRDQSVANEIPYHVVLKGRAIIDDPRTGLSEELTSGDIVLLPHGSPHVLHDGSGNAPDSSYSHRSSTGWVFSKNEGRGEQLDLLCGRFFIGPPHDRLIRDYLPTTVIVRAIDDNIGAITNHLANLVWLMRIESAAGKPGGHAILNALSSALFTLALRAVSESESAPAGLLALAGHPRLAPAISAMFADPARPWNLSDLADLCSMSRDSFMRHFHAKLGRSAVELLTDIRISLAANELKKPLMTAEAAAESVGYRSMAAFRRVFADRIGTTPGRWRRMAREGEPLQ